MTTRNNATTEVPPLEGESHSSEPLQETAAGPFEIVEPIDYGKYTLIARLGSGGMGDILLGLASSEVGAQKLVVIKRLHAYLVGERGLLDMFLDEARLATRLRHPNVVATHEVDRVGDSYFMAMEYLEGHSLDHVLKACRAADRPLPAEVAARIAVSALEGLHYLHELHDFDGTPLEVVHRDISPHNIFVSYDGTVKLIDFGVAKANPNVVKTQTGVVKGKYPYMAPEQAEGNEIDRRVDVWAMGVVLFEMLAGERPFQASSLVQLIKQVLFVGAPELTEVVPDAPPGLAKIVSKALERDLEQRYATAAEMAAALEVWLVEQERDARHPEIRELMNGLYQGTMREHRELIGRAMAGDAVVTKSGEVVPAGELRTVIQAETEAQAARAAVSPGEGADREAEGDRATEASRSGPQPVAVAEPDAEVEGDDPSEAEAPPEPSAGLGPGTLPASTTPTATSPTHVSPNTRRTPPGASVEGEAVARRSRGAWLASGVVVLVLVGVFSARGFWSSADAPEELEPASRVGAGPASVSLSPAEEPPVPEAPRAAPSLPVETGSEPALIDGPASPSREAESTEAVLVEAPVPEPETSATEPSVLSRRRAPRPRTPSPRPESRAVSPSARVGYLTFDSVPWATVSIDGRELGTTPLFRESLPAGNHTLTLVNPEEGLQMRYRVTIVAGETTTRRVGLH